jgi:hypothetical protein
MNAAVRHMTKQNRGVVVIGTLEPDLRSYIQLTSKKDLRSAMATFGRIPPSGGGWVLSGHYLVRAPHIDELEAYLDDALPGPGYDRVEIKKISDSEDLLANVVKIMDYMSKYPATLFEIPSRGISRKLAEQELSKMVTAFRGFHLGTDDLDGTSFSVDAAIRQWAVFMDRVGFNKLYFAVENSHAQMWLSESELRFVRRFDIDTDTVGNELIEPFRNHHFDYSDAPGQNKTRKTGYIRTRRLRKDQAWIDATDMSKQDPSQPVLFTHWP